MQKGMLTRQQLPVHKESKNMSIQCGRRHKKISTQNDPLKEILQDLLYTEASGNQLRRHGFTWEESVSPSQRHEPEALPSLLHVSTNKTNHFVGFRSSLNKAESIDEIIGSYERYS